MIALKESEDSPRLRTVRGEVANKTRYQKTRPHVAKNVQGFKDVVGELRAPRKKITPVCRKIEQTDRLMSREELMDLVAMVK